MKLDLYTKTVLTVIALLLMMILASNMKPRGVKAQGRTAETLAPPVLPSSVAVPVALPQSSCTSATMGSFYPLFACAVDLDGNGTKQMVVGLQASNIAAGQPGTFKVVIINGNGTIRATVPVE